MQEGWSCFGQVEENDKENKPRERQVFMYVQPLDYDGCLIESQLSLSLIRHQKPGGPLAMSGPFAFTWMLNIY